MKKNTLKTFIAAVMVMFCVCLAVPSLAMSYAEDTDSIEYPDGIPVSVAGTMAEGNVSLAVKRNYGGITVYRLTSPQAQSTGTDESESAEEESTDSTEENVSTKQTVSDNRELSQRTQTTASAYNVSLSSTVSEGGNYMALTMWTEADLTACGSISYLISTAYPKTDTAEVHFALVTTTVSCEDGSIVSEKCYAECGKWQRIYCDISSLSADSRSEVTSVVCRVDFMGTTSPEYLMISPSTGIEKNTVDFDRAEKVLSGEITVTTASRSQTLNSGGSVVISGGTTVFDGLMHHDGISLASPQATDAFVLAAVNVSVGTGSLDGTKISFGTLDSTQTSLVYTDTPSYQLHDGRYIYVFPIDYSTSIAQYRIVFSAQSDFKGRVTLESISLVNTHMTEVTKTAADTQMKVSFNDDGKLVISGKLDANVLKGHYSDSISLYAVPYNNNYSYENSTLIESKSASLTYEFIFSEDNVEKYAGTHMFYLALDSVSSDGTTVSQPLTNPHGIDASRKEYPELSVVGIDGASSVSVFESNSSRVIVDVMLDELISEDSSAGGAHLHAQDGSDYYVSSSVMDSVSTEVGFYNSAGIRVYIRLEAEEEFYNLMSTEKGICLLSSVVEYMCSGQITINGIILGDGFAFGDFYLRSLGTDAFGMADCIARAVRILYSSAAVCNDMTDFTVIVPFEEGNIYTNTMIQMISYLLGRYGSLSWCVLYTFQENFSDAEQIISAAASFGLNYPTELMLFYIPDPAYTDEESGKSYLKTSDMLIEEFDSVCTLAENSGARGVFFSVIDLPDTVKETLFSKMKQLRREDSKSSVLDTEAYIGSAECERYTLYDFGTKFSTDSWNSGGSTRDVSINYSDIFTEYNGSYSRCLCMPVVPYTGSTSTAIIVRNFSKPVDMSSVTELCFELALKCSSYEHENATVIIVLGNDTSRAEFFVSDFEFNTAKSVICNVAESGYEGMESVSYIGVIVYSPVSCTLELEKVTAGGEQMAESDIAGLFSSDTVTTEPQSRKDLAAYFIVITAVLTAIIAIIIFHNEREKAKESEKERR